MEERTIETIRAELEEATIDVLKASNALASRHETQSGLQNELAERICPYKAGDIVRVASNPYNVKRWKVKKIALYSSDMTWLIKCRSILVSGEEGRTVTSFGPWFRITKEEPTCNKNH